MNNIWYQNLNKSVLTPPMLAMNIIWGIIYALIFTALIIFLAKGIRREDTPALVLFTVNLLLNFSWPYIFFVQHNLLLSLVLVVLMILTLLPLIVMFGKKSKTAAAFLIVYLVWLIFALYLNYAIVIGN